MAVISFLVISGHVDDGKSECGHVPVLNQDNGPLQLIPMIDSSVCVFDEIGLRFIGKPLIFPLDDAVAGNQMIRAPVAPVVC